MASKQQMARELIGLGCSKSLNTLRQYPALKLELMLQEVKQRDQAAGELPAQEPIPPAAIAPPIPTDAEIRRAALATIPVAHHAPEHVPESRFAQWVALAAAPILMLRGILGL